MPGPMAGGVGPDCGGTRRDGILAPMAGSVPHRYSVEVEPEPGGFRWKIRENGKLLERSQRLYPSAEKAYAQARQTTPEKSLYDRLGGVFAIAAVVDHFSDAVVKNPIVGQKSKNPQLREWHTKNLKRLPGLKFMRTLWVCNVSGGPFQFTATKPGTTKLGLEEAHRQLRISPAEFDEVAAELGRTLDFAKVPKRERAEVLAAFAAHKNEVTAGYAGARRG